MMMMLPMKSLLKRKANFTWMRGTVLHRQNILSCHYFNITFKICWPSSAKFLLFFIFNLNIETIVVVVSADQISHEKIIDVVPVSDKEFVVNVAWPQSPDVPKLSAIPLGYPCAPPTRYTITFKIYCLAVDHYKDQLNHQQDWSFLYFKWNILSFLSDIKESVQFLHTTIRGCYKLSLPSTWPILLWCVVKKPYSFTAN